MKFITDMSMPPAEVPVRILLEVDADGDIVLKATNGVTTAALLYILEEGKITFANCYGAELEKLGFKTNSSGEVRHNN